MLGHGNRPDDLRLDHIDRNLNGASEPPRRFWLRIMLLALALIFAAFVYRPALFGFYGVSYEQCLLLIAKSASTSRGFDAGAYSCRVAHGLQAPSSRR